MKQKKFPSGALLIFGLVVVSCSTKLENRVEAADNVEFTLQRSLPHDPKAFTQGLVIHQGQLYESTGQEGSWIGVVDVNTGRAEKLVVLDNKYFGEGIVILNKRIYQLTWRSKIGFIYSLNPFGKIGDFSYEGEGWGLTTDGEDLIMSNGSSTLTFLDSATLKVKRTVPVTFRGNPVENLNELEYAEGLVYANVWQTDLIARIDPATGDVKGFLNLSALSKQARAVNPQAEVLNGIAWHPSTKTMLVTGKLWPYIFILKLKEK